MLTRLKITTSHGVRSKRLTKFMLRDIDLDIHLTLSGLYMNKNATVLVKDTKVEKKKQITVSLCLT